MSTVSAATISSKLTGCQDIHCPLISTAPEYLQNRLKECLKRTYKAFTGEQSSSSTFLLNDIHVIRKIEQAYSPFMYKDVEINLEDSLHKKIKISLTKPDIHTKNLSVTNELNATESAKDIEEFSNQVELLVLTLQEMLKFNEVNEKVHAKGSADSRVCSFAATKVSEDVQKVIDETIPYSDWLAIARNCIGLIVTILALATPIGLVGASLIMGVLAILSITIFVLERRDALQKHPENASKINLMFGIKIALSVCTILGAYFFALHFGSYDSVNRDTMKIIFGALVTIQGLYFIKQGYNGWFQQGNKMRENADKVNDPTLNKTGLFKMTSGGLSAFEGVTWAVLGVLRMIVGFITLFLGIPDCEIIDKCGSWIDLLTTILFDMVFIVSYTSSIISGNRDLARHEAIRKEFMDALGKREVNDEEKAKGYLRALKLLKEKLTIDSGKAIKEDKVLLRELLKLGEVISDSFDILDQVDVMIKELEKALDDKRKGIILDDEWKKIFEIAGYYVDDILASFDRSITIDKWTVRLGWIGLIGGVLVNHGIMALGGEFNMPGIPGTDMHFQALIPAAGTLGTVSEFADWTLWIYVNKLFKDKLDAPAGRTNEQNEHFEAVKTYLKSVLDKRTSKFEEHGEAAAS